MRIWDTRALAEQVAAEQARTEAIPPIEAKVATALVDSTGPGAFISTLVASSKLEPRERELILQVAMQFASKGRPADYRAPRAQKPIEIDGRIDEAA